MQTSTIPSTHDTKIVLANKAVSELGNLIKYLEINEPSALLSENLLTAQYILSSYANKVSSIDYDKPIKYYTSGSFVINQPMDCEPLSGNYKNVDSPFSNFGSHGVYTTTTTTTTTATTSTASTTEDTVQTPKTQTDQSQNSTGYKLSLFDCEIPKLEKIEIETEQIDFQNCSLSDFSFLDILGAGSFGMVQLCRYRDHKKHFCMKIMDKARIVKSKQVEHVFSEKDLLKQVSHPFVVKLYRTFQDKTNLYLLLEFVPGGELFDFIMSAGRFTDDIAKIYTAEIIMAFEYLHSRRIAYRDLKPENLLVDEDGHIKLADFGFAKYVTDRTYSLCGTAEYMSPEMTLGRGHDVATDWWSLGILIFEMLSGHTPFCQDRFDQRTMFNRIVQERVTIPNYFHPLAADIVLKLLNTNPSERMGFVRCIKEHDWFSGVDWNRLYEKKYYGPLNPKVTSDGDIHNFRIQDVDLPQSERQNPNIMYDQIFADF